MVVITKEENSVKDNYVPETMHGNLGVIDMKVLKGTDGSHRPNPCPRGLIDNNHIETF